MKIIAVVENLDKGAVENWLVRIFLQSKAIRPDWQWTFYCMLGKPGRLDEEVRAAGGTIIYSPVEISSKWAFLKNLRRTLKAGSYDILHAHHDFLSGFYLLASAGIKFKKRIVHVHNTDRALPVGSRVLEKILLRPFRSLALYFSDLVLGISKETLADFVGNRSGKKYQVLYYGINMADFEKPVDTADLRKQLNLPGNAKLLLFIGRMNAFKNPVFVAEVLAELLKTRNDVYALMAGTGDLENVVKEKAVELDIQEHIRMLGWCNDTVPLMKASDVFIFPRKPFPKEGLGLVVVEAQAAGLPMLVSDGIVSDAIVIRELVHVLPLDKGVQEWAKETGDILSNAKSISRQEALAQMKASHFELGKATRNLVALYEDSTPGA